MIMKLSENHKINISKSLKKAHSEGRHPGWEHINSNPDKMSYPEKFIQKILINNNIYERYSVLHNLKINKYFLDFAIIELKIDIEIDGSQHFRNDLAILHDKKRNLLLESIGWKIYRICWIEFNNDTKQQILKLLNFIENAEKQTSVYYDIKLFKKQKKTKNEIILDRKNKYYKSQEHYIDIVLNSNINFLKYGWVQKVAILINQKPSKVNKWMKNIMPDFYTKCYKRKIPR